MKRVLFFLLGVAVAVSASAGVHAVSLNKKIAKMNRSINKVEQVVRTANGPITSTPAPMFKAPAKVDIPEGYAAVTLTAGDVWGDGSGYQMLLDADATAYGVEIPETGGLTASGDASEEVYAAFEYKIPENADGSLTTENIVINNSITILIPAGIYDYCITNPTPGDRVWIASNGGDPARADDYEFQAGLTYEFSLALNEETGNDFVTLKVIEPGIALTTPENLTVDPAATSADVAWEDTDDNAWNLRWRPWTDTSGNPMVYDFSYADIQNQLTDWYSVNNDTDTLEWELYWTDDAHTDLCWGSASWTSANGALSPDNWLIAPELALEGVCKFKLMGSTTYPDHLGVYVLIGWDPAEGYAPAEEDLVLLAEYDIEAQEEVKEIDLSAYEGQTGRIVFRHFNCTDMTSLYIDDFSVGKFAEDAEWTNVNGLTSTSYTIEGLTPETKYEVQVQAAGASSTSDWTEIVEFTTLAEQTGLRGDVDDNGNVDISDVTALIDFLLSGEGDVNLTNADCDLNGGIDISDVTALIDYLLSGVWAD